MKKKTLGRPVSPEGRRKQFQAVVSPATFEWFEKQEGPPGRVLDRLVKERKGE